MTKPTEKNGSELRLFLSVDIHGSLALKNQKNHTVLLNLYEERKGTFFSFQDKGLIDPKAPDLDEGEPSIQALLSDYSLEDSDWGAILQQRFSDFHSAFGKGLVEADETQLAEHVDHYLWKTAGDELIYSFRIMSRRQLHEIVVSFLRVIRQFDEKDVDNEPIRLKGTGWVAGFPIRNRQITFPGPVLYRKKGERRYEEVSHPRIDYVGPDMDAGFRLAKLTHPGFMVISLELAELLGEANVSRQVRGMIVDWQKLKSVWSDTPYPVIWISLPEEEKISYSIFEPWSASEIKAVASWKYKEDEQDGVPEIKALINPSDNLLDKIRARLPASLGLVKPYIVQESQQAPLPEEHETILRILRSLSEGIAGPQDVETDGQAPRTGRTKEDVSGQYRERKK